MKSITPSQRLVVVSSPADSRLESPAPMMLLVTALCAFPAAFQLTREQAAIGVAALVLLPVIYLTIRTGRLIVTDPIIVVGAMWVLAVSGPILVPYITPDLYRDPIWKKLPPWTLDESALWMYRGWAACSVAYWCYRANTRDRKWTPPVGGRSVGETRLRVAIGLVGLVGAISTLVVTRGQSYTHLEGFAVQGSINMIIDELELFAVVYIFLYFRAQCRRQSLPSEIWLLVALCIVELALIAATSSKSGALQIGAAWLLGSASGTRKGNLLREVVLVSIAVVFVYATFYVITAYREELKQRVVTPSASIAEVIETNTTSFGVAVDSLLSGKPLGEGADRYDAGNMVDRLAHVAALGMVLDYTQGAPPFENAWESLMTPLLAVIPRDMVDQKVIFMGSATFAQNYAGWAYGGLSISLPGSFYWAWGYTGIIVGMAAIGLVTAIFGQAAERSGATAVIASALLFRLVVTQLDLGGEFQPILVGLTRSFLILLAIATTVRAFESLFVETKFSDRFRNSR